MADINGLDEYQVILIDHDNADITDKVAVLEYEDSVTQNIVLTLNARDGRFITKEGTQVIRQWDRIFVKITPKTGDVISDVFHVKAREKRRTQGRPEQYILHCPHESSNLWSRTIGLPARRVSGREALKQAVGILNAGSGDDDPEVEIPEFDYAKKAGNLFDPNTSNEYIFEAVPFQAVADELSQRELEPPEGGGSFEAMYIRFKSKYDGTDDADLGKVYLQAFPQGYHGADEAAWSNDPSVTFKWRPIGAGERPSILSFSSDLQTEKGTNLIALGDKTSGTYPVDHAKYSGARDVWDSARPWASGVRYREGRLVTRGGTVYECVAAHTSATGTFPPTANWVARTFSRPADWEEDKTGGYSLNDLVSYRGIAYKCISASGAADGENHPQMSRDHWARVSWAPATHYSPMTKDKAQYWINALGGARYASRNENLRRTAILDPTVIISDRLHPRTWVDWVGTNQGNIPPALRYIDTSVGLGIPIGFRVLVANPYTGGNAGATVGSPLAGNPNTWAADSEGEGDFSLSDDAGNDFAGNIAVYEGLREDGTRKWRVLRVCEPDQEVYDFYEGLSWTYQPRRGFFAEASDGSLSWSTDDRRYDNWIMGSYLAVALPGEGLTNALFNYGLAALSAAGTATAVIYRNSTGVNKPDAAGQLALKFQRGVQFDCAHPVKWRPDSSTEPQGAGQVDCGNERLLGASDGDGVGSAVFIKSEPLRDGQATFIGLNFRPRWPPNRLNAPYDHSDDIGSVINLSEFDFNNMHRDHTGKASWLGPGAEDYYPIHGFSFWQRLTINDGILLGNPQIAGDYKMAIWLADANDNVVILPYQQRRNNTTVAVDVPMSGRQFFEAVRSSFSPFASLEPEILNVFDDRRWVIGGIFTLDSFDEQGRELGIFSRFNTATEMKLSIDAFRMTKPLVCTSADEEDALPDRAIEPQKIAAEKIASYAQLKNYVLGLQRLYDFDRDEYILESEGKGDVAFGDPVYVDDPHLIGADADKVRAVADKITYSISKTRNGPGGFRRTVHAVTRVWGNE